MPAQASFIYPVNGAYKNIVNVIDVLDVTYDSQWDALNLTLFCQVAGPGSAWYFHNVASNPILANGTFRFYGIDGLKFPINQYPTDCHYKLTEYRNNTNSINGGSFNITSTAGAVKTFAYTASGTATSLPTQSATSTGTAVSSIASSDVSATATSSSQPSTSTGASSGLSTGAKAGIGVGVALGVLLLLALLGFFVLRKRRQRSVTANSATVADTPMTYPQKDVKHPQPHESMSMPVHEKPAEGDGYIPPQGTHARAELP